VLDWTTLISRYCGLIWSTSSIPTIVGIARIAIELGFVITPPARSRAGVPTETNWIIAPRIKILTKKVNSYDQKPIFDCVVVMRHPYLAVIRVSDETGNVIENARARGRFQSVVKPTIYPRRADFILELFS
jgi:hypothetical protein